MLNLGYLPPSIAFYNRISSNSMPVITGPRQLADDNLYDPNSFDVYSYAVHPSSQKTPTRRIDPAKIPRRAIDLFAGLKLKGRSTTTRRRRSTVMTIVRKERKSSNFSSNLAKKSEYLKTVSSLLRSNSGYTDGIKRTFAKLRSVVRFTLPVDGR